MTRASFVSLIERICGDENISLSLFSMDWILKLQQGDRMSFVYGYNFDINGSAGMQICGDKNAAFLCMNAASIPAVPHLAFMNPADPLVSRYVECEGVIPQLHTFAKQHEYNVVLKPLRGTGGEGVIHARNGKQLEAAVLKLFSKDYALAISPFKVVKDEFRVVLLNGSVRLTYRKDRISVTGNGLHTVQELMAIEMAKSARPHQLAHAMLGLSERDLEHCVETGVRHPVQWKHNLGLGAEAEVVEYAEIGALAVRAAKSLNMNFCSVDIIEVDGEGLMVLEVNSGVMMDSFLSSSEDNWKIAKSIYTDAILSLFG